MSVVAPSELYTDPEVLEQFNERWVRELPLEQMLVAADIIVDQEDPVAFLDELEDSDQNAWFKAKHVITSLPAEVVFKNYGLEMLAWATANAGVSDTKEKFEKGLTKHASFDIGLFEKGRLWEWQRNFTTKGKTVLDQYLFMEKLVGGALDKVDLKKILVESAVPGIELSEKRLDDYALVPIRSVNGSFRPDGPAEGYHAESDATIAYSIWLDAPTGFVLNYKGKPNAAVGLARSHQDELTIYQLQGVQAKRLDPEKRYTEEYVTGTVGARGLATLDWQKVMVDITEELAKQLGISNIGIQSGKNNKWTTIFSANKTEPHLSKEMAVRAYDVPAQRLGFSIGRDGNWHRQISKAF